MMKNYLCIIMGNLYYPLPDLQHEICCFAVITTIYKSVKSIRLRWGLGWSIVNEQKHLKYDVEMEA